MANVHTHCGAEVRNRYQMNSSIPVFHKEQDLHGS